MHVRSNYLAHMRRSTSNVPTKVRTMSDHFTVAGCHSVHLQIRNSSSIRYKISPHISRNTYGKFFQTSLKNRPRRQLYFCRGEWRDSDIVVQGHDHVFGNLLALQYEYAQNLSHPRGFAGADTHKWLKQRRQAHKPYE